MMLIKGEIYDIEGVYPIGATLCSGHFSDPAIKCSIDIDMSDGTRENYALSYVPTLEQCLQIGQYVPNIKEILGLGKK